MTTIVLLFFTFLIAVLGACLGSFLNVVIWRVPEGMSLLTPPSHCPKCNAPVRWFDNIPMLSWFILGGKCRSCHAPISFRYPMVEAFSCLTALVVGGGLLWGGIQGFAGQAMNWSHITDDLTYCTTYLEQYQNHSASLPPVEYVSIIVDRFFQWVFIVVLYSVLWTVLADTALMLGFVQFDKNYLPCSLLITTLVILMIYLSSFGWIQMNEKSQICFPLASYGIGSALGVLPAIGVKKKSEKLFVGLLGALWGGISGVYLALPGMIVSLMIDRFVFCQTGRHLLGIVVSSVILLLLVIDCLI